MDPLTIGLGLIQAAPALVKWFTGSDKDAAVAQKAIDIAKVVTGKSSGEDALATLQANPQLALQYQQSVLAASSHFDELILQNAADINKTMQTEAVADHWPTYSWRPFIGFSFGAYVTAQWLLPLFHLQAPTVDPTLMTAIGAVLGIASFFRGKMQADPSVPTDNRG